MKVFSWITLALGLLVSAAIGCSLSLDYSGIHGLHGDGIMAYAPGQIAYAAWDSARYSPFTHAIPVSYFLEIAIYFGSTALVGVLMLQVLLGNPPSFPFRLLSGFCIGYLASVGINRLLTLFFSHASAPMATFLLPWFLLIGLGASQGAQPLLALYGEIRKSSLLAWLGTGVLLTFFILFQIQFGRNFMVGDSTSSFFIPRLEEMLNPLVASAHLPLVDQQSDEICYVYPLIFGSGNAALLLIPFWLVDAVGKVSVAVLLFEMLARGASLHGKILISVAVAYIYLGSPGCIPYYYFSLFGGQNPLVYNPHIGRLLGIALPILFIVCQQKDEGERQGNRFHILSISLTGILLGLGIAELSIHVAALAGGVLLLAFVFCIWDAEQALARQTRHRAIYFIPMILLYGLVLSYCPSSTAPLGRIPGMWMALSLAPVASLVLIHLHFPHLRAIRKQCYLVGSVFLSMGLGLLSLGNVFCFALMCKSNIPALFPVEWMTRHAIQMPQKELYFHVASPEFPVISLHTFSGTLFMVYYGLLIIVVSGATVLLMSRFQGGKPLGRDAAFAFIYISVFLGLLDVGLFKTDFIDDGIDPWAKDRLVEVPYYCLFLFAAFAASRLLRPIPCAVLTVITGLWAFVPFTTNGGWRQVLLNAEFLARGGTVIGVDMDLNSTFDFKPQLMSLNPGSWQNIPLSSMSKSSDFSVGENGKMIECHRPGIYLVEASLEFDDLIRTSRQIRMIEPNQHIVFGQSTDDGGRMTASTLRRFELLEQMRLEAFTGKGPASINGDSGLVKIIRIGD